MRWFSCSASTECQKKRCAHLNDSPELFMHAVEKLSLRWFKRERARERGSEKKTNRWNTYSHIYFNASVFFCRFQKCFRRHLKKIRFLLFTVHSVGTLLSLRHGVCLFLLSLLYFIVVYSHITTTKRRRKKKCAGEHIKLCRQETNTHAIQFDIVSESFHIGTGRYSRNMRAWMTTTIMLKVVMTTRIIASIKLRTNPLYQTLLMIEQWMILYLVCRFW